MGGNILYIDDENQLPAGFEEELSAAGYNLLHASDPDQALMLVRVEEIDLVLMEVMLTTCNGMALMEEIRSYGGWPAEVPIIVLTQGERSPELYGGSLELGAKEFLTKPVLKAELLESVLQFAGVQAEPAAVDPAQSGSAPAGEAALTGDLDDNPISEVLHRLRQDAASGVLTATQEENKRAVELRNGSPVAISSSGDVEAPEAFLVRRGLITEKQRKAVKKRVAAGEGGSGQILVAMGALSEQDLSTALCERAEEQLLQTFRWTSGYFRYFPGKQLKAESALEIDRNPAELLFEGALHWSPERSVAHALRERSSLFVSTVDEPPCDRANLELSSSQRVFFEHMYGDRSVQEVLDAGELDERTLYGLFVAGLLLLHEEPVVMLLDELATDTPPRSSKPQPPVPSEREPAKPQPPARADQPAEPPERAPAEPLPDFLEPPSQAAQPLAAPAEEPLPFIEPSVLSRVSPQLAPTTPPPAEVEPIGVALEEEHALAELTSFCERIRSQDDFDALGISEEASDEEVGVAHRA
ncbi:MAG: response regulator, partial [Myxococcota bacterium]